MFKHTLRTVLMAATVSLVACATPPLPAGHASYLQAWHSGAQVEDLRIAAGNQVIAVQHFGKPVAGKSPLVMLHGFPDNQRIYDKLASLLAADHDVYTFDFVGWGSSSKPPRDQYVYDTAALPENLQAVLDALGARQFVFVSHDIGTIPVIDWALKNPERVKSIVLLNSMYFNSRVMKVFAAA